MLALRRMCWAGMWRVVRTIMRGLLLMSRIAPPLLVVSDGGSGFRKAKAAIWPTTQVQRCTFHAYNQVKRYTTMNPRLPAGRELLRVGTDLLRVGDVDASLSWLTEFNDWCVKWQDFLDEQTIDAHGNITFTHEKLINARNCLIRLIKSGNLFTYLDSGLVESSLTSLPAMNNQIEGAVNAQLREILRNH